LGLFFNLRLKFLIVIQEPPHHILHFLFSNAETRQAQHQPDLHPTLINLNLQPFGEDPYNFFGVILQKPKQLLTRLKRILDLSQKAIITVGCFQGLELFWLVNFEVDDVLTDERAVEVAVADFLGKRDA
jgi:hypothetical protein